MKIENRKSKAVRWLRKNVYMVVANHCKHIHISELVNNDLFEIDLYLYMLCFSERRDETFNQFHITVLIFSFDVLSNINRDGGIHPATVTGSPSQIYFD